MKLWTLFLIIVFCHTAFGQPTAASTKPDGKNSPAVETLALQTDEGDKRLQTNVKLEIRHEPLAVALERIGKETKIEFEYEEEWIRELNLTAFTKDIPIYTAMHHIATLHNLSWRKKYTLTGSLPRYELFESDSNRQAIARLKNRSTSRLSQRFARYRRYADMSGAELESLAQDGDAWASFFSSPESQAAARLIASLPESELPRLQSRHSVSFRYDDLTSQGQKAFADLLLCKFKDNVAPDPASCIVRYSLQGEGADANISAFVSFPQGGFMPPLIFDTGGNSRLLSDVSLPRYAKELLLSQRAPVVPLPKSGTILTRQWDEFVDYTAERFDLNLFAEAYPGFPDIDDRPTAFQIKVRKGERFSNLLDSCGSWGRDWHQAAANGKDILLRLPDWFEYRDGGATQRLLNRILKSGKKEAVRLDLRDWMEISSLPTKQISRVESVLGVDAEWIKKESHVLLFLRELSGSQMSNLTGKGLILSSLPEAQRHSFVDLKEGKSDYVAAWSDGSGPIITLVNEGENSLLIVKANRKAMQASDTVELVCRFPCRIGEMTVGEAIKK